MDICRSFIKKLSRAPANTGVCSTDVFRRGRASKINRRFDYQPSTSTASSSDPYPCVVYFWRVHLLDLMPRPHGIVVGRTVVVRHIVGNEVYVARVLDPQRTALALVQRDRLMDQVAVRDPATRSNLFFAPPVEQIAGPRCPLEARLDLRGFPLDERLGLLVACVMDNREVEMQSSIYITLASLRRYGDCLNL